LSSAIQRLDQLVEVQCDDEAHFSALINGVVRKPPAVSGIDTMVYPRFHTRAYAWPPGSWRPARTL